LGSAAAGGSAVCAGGLSDSCFFPAKKSR